MHIQITEQGFTLKVGAKIVLEHANSAPCLFIGQGIERMDMYRGNFEIEDYVVERIALHHAKVEGDTIHFASTYDAKPAITAQIIENELHFNALDNNINRLWLRVPSAPNEHVWGGGEQMSYFDMKGRRFPLWTSEPGVGRDKTTELTFKADVSGKSGGDYYNTNYPQPTYLSSRRYALHVDTTAYSVFDFRQPEFHEIEIWEVPAKVEFFEAEEFTNIVTQLAERFGKQPQLPEWIYNGAIIGLKDGTESFERLDVFRTAGTQVSGLWCEDWVGLRHTSFGARLFWDWKANDERYPALRQKIAELNDQNIRFLGYVNPYLCADGSLFPIAEQKGYFATNHQGNTALVDFGEFDCGVVDFTNPEAADWFAEVVIGQSMLDFGLSGWMADFGEYLPIDINLANGVDAKLMHNAWPVLWAEVNAKAIQSRGKTGDATFFMRAGYSGFQAYCPLLWGGDQSVDFTRHDGLVSVICGALSSGLLGNAYHHSDIGGYTSLFGNIRTPELIMRWSEMAAFTSVMRSHEGNRPKDNLQIDQDSDVLAHFAKMTRIYCYLAPYLKALSAEAFECGLPVQRPLFLHYQHDQQTYAIQDAYLFGRDLLVAPVWHAGDVSRDVYLPHGDDWTHVWSGETFAGGQEISVAAPIGQPAVFYRTASSQANYLSGIKNVE
jgi:alpha-glucosidase